MMPFHKRATIGDRKKTAACSSQAAALSWLLRFQSLNNLISDYLKCLAVKPSDIVL